MLCVHSKVLMVLLPRPVPPAQPPRKALGKWWGTLVQVGASRGGPAVRNLRAAAPHEKGGKAQPGTKTRYSNGEIAAGPGLCVHARTAAGSDYAATMFCSINIMSSLNLY